MAKTCRHRDVNEHGFAVERCLREGRLKIGARLYCAKHGVAAENDMNAAKDEVVKQALAQDKAMENGAGLIVMAAVIEASHAAIDHLKELGFEPGD